MWETEVARGDGPVPFLLYRQRRHRVTEHQPGRGRALDMMLTAREVRAWPVRPPA